MTEHYNTWDPDNHRWGEGGGDEKWRAKVFFCSCFPKDVSQAVMVIKWLTVSSSVYEVTRSNITNVLYPTPRWGQIDGDKINTIVPPSLLPRTANWPTWSVSWEDGVLIIMTGNDTRMIHVPVHHHYHPIHCTHTYTHLVIHCNSPLNPFPSRPTAVHWPSQHNWQTICNHEDLQTIISLDNCLRISHLSCHVFNVKSAELAWDSNMYLMKESSDYCSWLCVRWTVGDDGGGSLVIAPAPSSKQAWWRKCAVVDGSGSTQQSALLLWSNGPGHGKGCWMWWPTDFCSQFSSEIQSTVVGSNSGNKIELITWTWLLTIKNQIQREDARRLIFRSKMYQIACWW